MIYKFISQNYYRVAVCVVGRISGLIAGGLTSDTSFKTFEKTTLRAFTVYHRGGGCEDSQ